MALHRLKCFQYPKHWQQKKGFLESNEFELSGWKCIQSRQLFRTDSWRVLSETLSGFFAWESNKRYKGISRLFSNLRKGTGFFNQFLTFLKVAVVIYFVLFRIEKCTKIYTGNIITEKTKLKLKIIFRCFPVLNCRSSY